MELLDRLEVPLEGCNRTHARRSSADADFKYRSVYFSFTIWS